MENKYQALFNYMNDEHGIALLENEMQEIENIINPRTFPEVTIRYTKCIHYTDCPILATQITNGCFENCRFKCCKFFKRKK